MMEFYATMKGVCICCMVNLALYYKHEWSSTFSNLLSLMLRSTDFLSSKIYNKLASSHINCLLKTAEFVVSRRLHTWIRNGRYCKIASKTAGISCVDFQTDPKRTEDLRTPFSFTAKNDTRSIQVGARCLRGEVTVIETWNYWIHQVMCGHR
jgi:hypothetical protein